MKIRRALSLSIIPGMLLFAGLFLIGTISLWKLKAAPDPDTARVIEQFSHKIYLTLTRIALVHLWTGLVLGALSGIVLKLLFPNWNRHPFLFALLAVGLIGATCAFLSARLLIEQPTFFDQFLFAQGGLHRSLQLFLTDDLGLQTLNLIGGTAAGVLLLSSRSVRSLLPLQAPMSRAQKLFSLIVIVLGLSIGIRYFLSPPKPERPDRPNILLLSGDSLRLDHFSSQGYPRPTTPNIDRLAASSCNFVNAYVPVARTLPSWTSLLTSTHPHTHGIRHMFPDSERRQLPLPTLAGELRKHGYRSAVVSDFAGEMFDLIDYGYDLVDTPPSSDVDVLVERQLLWHFPLLFPLVNHWLGKRMLPVISYLTVNSDSLALAKRALRRFRELADDGPVFMTVFFSTTHAPYASPYPHYKKFTDPDYQGPHRYAYAVRDPRDLVDGVSDFTREDEEQIVALYDGALAHVDAAIGLMLEELEQWDFMDSTIILVTADHGEQLFEGNNRLDHGKWFRHGEHANHIPLLVCDPDNEFGIGPVEGLVRSIDVMPTLLSRLELPIPESVEGIDLLPYLRGSYSLPELPLFAETGVWLKAPVTFAKEPEAPIYPFINDLLGADPHDDSLMVQDPFEQHVLTAKHRMLRREQSKLVYEPTRTSVRFKLFDTESDPLNQRDVRELAPDKYRTMRDELIHWMELDPCRRFDAKGHLTRFYTDLE